MDHAYRLIWNAALEAYVPAPEFVRGQSRKSKGKAGVAAILSGLAMNALALPTDGQVSVGQGSIAGAGNVMTVTQTSPKLTVNWNSFNIAQGETVRFQQPGSSAIALNRVLGSDPSAIYGSLQANGQVFLLNHNGILFGRTAQVNTGGLVASTLSLSDQDFQAGKFTFKGNGNPANVINRGSIAASEGGYVALLSGQVSNEGTISAKLGTVALGAGNQVTLDFVGDRLVSLQVDEGAIQALAQNRQLIQADGGNVILTAKAADALVQAVVNNEGVIEARSVENRNGTIALLGDMQHGSVQVAGTLDGSAPNGGNGGFIETSAAHVKVADTARITTRAPRGKAGTWLIDPNDYTIAASRGDMSAAALSNSLDNNNVTILNGQGVTAGNGDIFVNDAIAWSANTTLTLSAYRDVNINANITATGNTAGLTLTPNTGGSGGSYNLNGAVITLSGTTPSLSIAGQSYVVINDANALQAMGNNLSGNYALGRNIDASATSGWNSSAGFVPVGGYDHLFSGIFDGLNHTIYDLTINRPAVNLVGLFGYTAGTIKNTGLVGVSVTGHDYVGGLVGLIGTDSAVSNSYSIGTVSGYNNVGGVAGASVGAISSSYSSGTVSGTNNVGGLLGYAYFGSISNGYSTAAVTGTTAVGGLVGKK